MSSPSSSSLLTPRTPTTSRYSSYGSRPLLSSPLAPLVASSSPGPTSPVVEAQARRRMQYKATGTPHSSSALPSRRYLSTGNTQSLSASETPQSAFLRERLKAKCLDRARRAREKNIQKRRASELSSDGFDVDMDSSDKEDEEDSNPFDDEIFRRIMANENRKREHAFRVSFEQNVGSSIDPSMEDITEWEKQLGDVEEEPTPPDDLFEEDDEYWASLYEELAQNEEPQPSESHVSPSFSTESRQVDGSYAQQSTLGHIDCGDMDTEL